MVAPERLADRYRIDRQVGLGGMGTVYSAVDEKLDRRVALKLLKRELASDPRFVERFRREARSAAALSHPNIANVFDYCETDDGSFIVMELVEGRDLSQVMREDGPMGAERSLAITSQIAAALGHAHSAGLVHRDVKPHNVIVMDDDRVKVTDFGIARATGESRLTATGTILGTAQYVSPEQAAGETPGPASDVYSLGIVLFEMVTGAVPFTGESPISVALRHVRDDVPPPSSIDPSLPPKVDEIVARATAKAPEQRFHDGNAFAAALGATTAIAAPTTPTSELPPGETSAWPFTTPPRWDPQRLGRVVVAVFALLFLMALGALAFRLASSKDDLRERTRAAAREQREGREAAEPTTSPADATVSGFLMPDYRGDPAPPAIQELEDAGMVVSPVGEECGQAAGYVCEQSPAPETPLEAGDAVTLVISTAGDDSDDGESEKDKGDKGPPEHANNDKDDD